MEWIIACLTLFIISHVEKNTHKSDPLLIEFLLILIGAFCHSVSISRGHRPFCSDSLEFNHHFIVFFGRNCFLLLSDDVYIFYLIKRFTVQ